jgi:hypothetical protein
MALLEDSGWYLPNWDQVPPLDFGRGAGCGLVQRRGEAYAAANPRQSWFCRRESAGARRGARRWRRVTTGPRAGRLWRATRRGARGLRPCLAPLLPLLAQAQPARMTSRPSASASARPRGSPPTSSTACRLRTRAAASATARRPRAAAVTRVRWQAGRRAGERAGAPARCGRRVCLCGPCVAALDPGPAPKLATAPLPGWPAPERPGGAAGGQAPGRPACARSSQAAGRARARRAGPTGAPRPGSAPHNPSTPQPHPLPARRNGRAAVAAARLPAARRGWGRGGQPFGSPQEASRC